METLGQFLKREREQRNISQEDVAKYTRYHIDRIHALEADQHKHLPPPPYVKGMLRSISKFLGLDVPDVLFRYEEFLKAQNEVYEPVLETKEIPSPPFYHQKNFLLVTATFSFLVLVVVVSLFFKESKKLEPVSPLPTLSEADQPADTPVTQGEGKYKLTVTPTKDVWLKVQLDTDAPYSLGVKSGSSTQIQAKKVIRLFVSDAQGVKLWFNGKEVSHASNGAKTFIFPPVSEEDNKN